MASPVSKQRGVEAAVSWQWMAKAAVGVRAISLVTALSSSFDAMHA
jgi:hypothetical protein